MAPAGLAVFALALSIRLAFIPFALQAGSHFYLTSDSQRYDRLALNLVHRHRFRAEPFQPEALGLPTGFEESIGRPGYLSGQDFYDGPEVKRVPLFPLVLGFFYRVFGYGAARWMVFQAFLGALTAWLLAAAGRVMGRPRIGIVAALLFACNPRSVLHVGQVQVEVTFIFLLVLLFLSALDYARRPRWSGALLFGGILAWAALSREMGIFLPLLFLPLAAAPLVRGEQRVKAAAMLLVVLIVPLLGVSAWVARNRHFTGHPVWTAHTAFSEAWYFAPKVTAAAWGVTEREARVRLLEELAGEHPEYVDDLERLRENPHHYWQFNHRVEMNLRARPAARSHLAANIPETIAAFAGGAFWSLWAGVGEWRLILISPAEYKEVFGEKTREAKQALFRLELTRAAVLVAGILGKLPLKVWVVFAFLWLYSAALYLLAAAGALRLLSSQPLIAVQLLLLVFLSVAVTGPSGNNRLFSIAYPFVSILAAAGAAPLFPGDREAPP